MGVKYRYGFVIVFEGHDVSDENDNRLMAKLSSKVKFHRTTL